MRKSVTFCIIAKNESKNLPACLGSIGAYPYEIVVIDTGSTDNTIEIAKRYTDKVYSFPFTEDNIDFSAARNEALKYATGDYIFQLDCDETLTESCNETIKKILDKEERALYLVTIASQMEGLPEPAISSNYRLFPNDPEIKYHFIVHENINNPGEDMVKGIPGKYPKLRNRGLVIHHTGYLRREKARKGTDNRNIKLLEKQIKLTPDEPYFFYHLGVQYYGIGEYEKSIAYYEKFLAFIKENSENIHKIYTPTIYEGLLVSCMRAGKKERMEEFKAIETINPGYYYNLGLWYDYEGHSEIALELFNKAIDNSKNANKLVTYDLAQVSWRPYIAKGEIYLEAKKYQRAIDCFKLALTESPKNTTIINLLARTYAIDYRPELAERFAEMAIKFEDTLNNRLHLADVYINFGKEDKGLEIYFKEASAEHLLMLRDAIREAKPEVAGRVDKFLGEREYLKTTTAKGKLLPSNSVTVVIPTLAKCNMELFEKAVMELSKSSCIKTINILDNTESGKLKEHPRQWSDKVNIFTGANRYVNPAWNFGLELTDTPYYLLLNDDVLVRPEIITECVALLESHSEIGVVTYLTENKLPEDYFKKGSESEEVLAVHVSLRDVSGGWFIFGRKENWEPIPEDLKIFCGDNWIYDMAVLRKHKEIVKVVSNFIVHFTSTTVNLENLYAKGVLDEERKTYADIKKRFKL